MIKFHSIGAFRATVAAVRKVAEQARVPYPTVEFVGMVKLHGTNAGIEIDLQERTVIAQSRERVLAPGKETDNAGFAAWVHENKDALLNWADLVFTSTMFNSNKLTVYGEWIGPGIQKNVGITQLPERQFVVFSVAYHDAIQVRKDGTVAPVYHHLGKQGSRLTEKVPGMRSIGEVAVQRINIDFAAPDKSIAILEELTAAYEARCPWAALHGIDGIGEGLVWVPATPWIDVEGRHLISPNEMSRLWFKTKGEKHGNPSTNNKVKVPVAAERLEDFNKLCDVLLPAWRLEQGFSSIQEPTRQTTGDFLKWVMADVYKEEQDVIEVSGFEWKVIVAELSRRARFWYMDRVV